MELSEDTLEKYRDRISLAVITARQEQGDGRLHQALSHLRRIREGLGGDRLPKTLRTPLDDEITELATMLNERYEELVTRLKSAKEGGSPDDIQQVLDDIEQTCGKEFRQQAEKSLP